MPNTRPEPRSPSRGVRRALRDRRGLLLACAVLAATSCLLFAAAAHGQSGRRKPPPLSPVPTPSPTPERRGESGSEARAKVGAEAEKLTFSVHRLDGDFTYIGFAVEESVIDAFVRRLSGNRGLSVNRGERMTRKAAQERAKKEEHTYFVLVELEEEVWGGGPPSSRTDAGALAVKTYVYEPKTGALKYMDRTVQRPYRPTTSIGGVRLPLPGPRTVERYPNELQLEQAARDAADRVMRRFNLTLPPD